MADETQCELLCGVCKSLYTSPRKLDCFHIFCSPCLEKLIEGKSTFPCPLCRMVFAVPKRGIEDFDLFPFHGLAKEKSEDENNVCCQMCDENEVYSLCKDCGQTMCRSCHEYHLKHKIFRGHKVEKYVKSDGQSMQRNIKRCDEHKKEYSVYCKSCNQLLCEDCIKSKHESHTTLPIENTASVLRHSLNVAINGLRSKIPYVNHFLENGKSDEKKYFSFDRQTRAEMKTAASNLKDMLCKSIDMILAQNMANLEAETRIDKKRIQTFNEEAERERLSVLSLIKTSNDTLIFADDCDIIKLASSICRQISSVERSCFQSELKILTPKFKCGSFSNKPMEDFMGQVERDERHTLDFNLYLPRNEMMQYPFWNKMEQILTISCDSIHQRIFVDCDHRIYLSHLSDLNWWNTDPLPETGNVLSMTLKGTHLWKTEGEKLKQERLTPFHIIGIRYERVFLMCCNSVKVIDFQDEKNIVISELNIDTPISSPCLACFLNNDNILIFNASEKTFFEVTQNGKMVRTMSNSNMSREHFSPCGILYTLSNYILVSCATEILSFDLSGDLVYSFDDPSAKFEDMCTDRHGNVFVADSEKGRVCQLTSDGHFVRDVLLRDDGIDNPKSITIDPRGNLCILMNNSITVFSYL